MQPPTPAEETKAKVSDNIGSDTSIKKRRLPVKKKKAAKPIEPDAAKVDPVVIATSSVQLSETRSPGPYRGKCRYQSRKCENERAIKRNGKPHNLCEEHRSKQNQHQRKFDAKKFSRKRRRDSVSDEDTKIDKQSHRNEEPSAKHHRPMTNQEAEARTPSHVTPSTNVYVCSSKTKCSFEVRVLRSKSTLASDYFVSSFGAKHNSCNGFAKATAVQIASMSQARAATLSNPNGRRSAVTISAPVKD
ncbi:hypothetical protein JG688_00013075 [Phytophthora aleatoria]|uniref:Uncharacterized protein n=1 Tax=Phytophthora aleatoria TaxID=2496075 RepID=A0A8J5IMI7_9STRA|nr:hypothetical protein JG688_00013075 [Phytophthora aleatoria]